MVGPIKCQRVLGKLKESSEIFFVQIFFCFKPFEQILNKYNYYPKFINHILPCQTQKTSSWQIIMALKKKRRLFESQKVIRKAVFGFELHSFMAISSNSQQNEVDAKKDSVTIKAGSLMTDFYRAQSRRICLQTTTFYTSVNLIQEISQQQK